MDTPQATERATTADVRRKLEGLVAEGRTGALIELVLSLLQESQDRNSILTARLHVALRALYGRRSEKVGSDQLALLFEALGEQVPASAAKVVADAAEAASGDVEQPTMPPKAPRGRRGRQPLPESLPREAKVIPVPDAERVCDICGGEKKCIGHVVSEILEFVPAQLKVIEERREKVACPVCVEGVVVARSEKVMDKGRPGPGLLANLIVDKFQDAMPIYRQGQAFARACAHLSRSTLGDWTAFGLQVLEPISVRIAQLVLLDFYVGADDTGLRVLDRQHPNGVKRGHLWAYVAMSARLVAFNYTPTWEAEGPKRFLKGFGGMLHTDGYAGFDPALEVPEGLPASGIRLERRLGCGMHIRRRFESAQDAGDIRGAIALAYFKKLYRLEDGFKAKGLLPEARHAQRQELSLPVVDELYTWVADVHPRLVPKTPLYQATNYALNQEDAWRRCFTDGRFEIDNGEVERQQRRVGIGRKNYLFAGSDAGAHRIAVAYTVLASCQMHNVNPMPYLTDVIEKIQHGWPKSRLDELLPHRWAPGPEPSMPPQEASAPADAAPLALT